MAAAPAPSAPRFLSKSINWGAGGVGVAGKEGAYNALLVSRRKGGEIAIEDLGTHSKPWFAGGKVRCVLAFLGFGSATPQSNVRNGEPTEAPHAEPTAAELLPHGLPARATCFFSTAPCAVSNPGRCLECHSVAPHPVDSPFCSAPADAMATCTASYAARPGLCLCPRSPPP